MEAAGASCTNCGVAGALTYCAACGERQPRAEDLTLRALAHEAGEELFSLDGRLWRSVVALLSRPGELTAEYFAGRRGRYMRPLSLFVLLNLLFFVARPYTGLLRYDYRMYTDVDGRHAAAEAKRLELELDVPAFAQRFNGELEGQKQTMMLFVVPLFACAVALLYPASGRRYAEHFVFSIHAFGFLLFFLLALGTIGFRLAIGVASVLGARAHTLAMMGGEGALTTVLGAGMGTYLTLGLRRYYRSGWAPAAARAAALFLVLGFLVIAYRNVLFITTLAFL